MTKSGQALMRRQWLLLCAATLFSMTSEASDCTPNAARIAEGRIRICDAEDRQERDVTPPPASALRLASGLAHAGIEPVKVASWPVRAFYSSASALYEFDRQGNVLSVDGKPAPGAYLAEYRLRNAAAWLGSQHVYYIVHPGQARDGLMLSDVTDAIVLAGQRPCAPSRVSEFYRLYRDLSDTFLNGLCDAAVRQRIGGRDYWVYPDEATGTAMPGDAPIHWTFQGFGDPVEPVIDAHGLCRLYCEESRPSRSHGNAREAALAARKEEGRVASARVAPRLDVSPPARSALRQLTSQERRHDGREAEEVRPADWPVRAIFNSRAGAFVFDRQGNLVENGAPLPSRVVELRLGGKAGQPLWQGGQQVYRLLTPAQLGYSNGLLGTDDGIVLVDGRACPTQRVSEAYGILHAQGALYLNGNCANAVRRAIGTGTFWVYPEDARTRHPQYWVVQYFDDPVTPVLDAEGQCWLYCDERRPRND
ncbi:MULTISPECIES: hypothetical protein [Cupriavidus]